MSQRTQDHQEQEANPQLVPNQDVQDQAPLHQQASPAAAARRAKHAPEKLAPNQVLALQKTVGNRAVQRLVQSPSGAVQRHMDARTRGEIEDQVSTRMFGMHPEGGVATGSSSRMEGDKLTVESQWLASTAE
jgi:hypothetical protein